MSFRVVRTNQYNQDLGLIHSTNGNHLESPNEGSSIDHQRLTNPAGRRGTGVTRSAFEVYGNYPLVLDHSILVAAMTSRAHRSTTCSTVTHNSLGTVAQNTASGSYELHQRYHTSLTQQKAINKLKARNFTYPNKLGAKFDAYSNRLHKGDVFAHLTSFKQTFENDIQTKRLNKRSPMLPPSLSLELPTVDNRRR
ncbi:hypothetical protein F511_39189 [Dorcoceras hygrometricum]|uniref:Uncharacterized protein n=1 Tax=Dorcoceras hygrometricum TaxID=472368 RepID=A0A2Z7B441_9LAMI|nr:hypothetical protein F511_39189 [Dorcoceras hygrometricum]